MTAAEARAWIEDETQWQSAPVLTAAEVDRLLFRARVPDVAGVLPGGVGYVDTYATPSLHRAAAAGWRMKGAKVVAEYDAGAGDGVYAKRSRVAEMCDERAAWHEAEAKAWADAEGAADPFAGWVSLDLDFLADPWVLR